MINESVYGQPSSWADYGNNINQVKVANFGSGYNLYTGVNNGKLSYDEPIDQSIAFCGIGKECPFSNLVYYHNENGSILNEVKAKNISNYFIGSIPSVYDNYYDISAAFTLYDASSAFDVGVWEKGGDNMRNANLYVQPVADFKPQNIVLCIYIDCKQTKDGATVTTYLKNYIDNRQYIQYPYVERVYADILIGNYREGETNTRTTPLLTADFLMFFSSLEEFESSYIDVCHRYNSLKANNDNSVPILFSPLSTTNFSYDNIICLGDFTNDPNFDITADSNHIWRMSYHVTNKNVDEFNELCLRATAQYGLYFSDEQITASSGNFTDENMYIGVIDSEGITHGNYLKGKHTAESAQAQWDTIRDSPYDYKKNDPNNYYKFTTLPSNGISSVDKFYFHSIVARSTFRSTMISALYEISQIAPTGTTIEEILTEEWKRKQKFMFQEPIECIAAWRIVLLKPPTVASDMVNIKIGWFETQNPDSRAYVKSNEFDTINLGTKYITPKFYNCLDYEPYTKMTLYIPFCGTVELPMATFMGHNINLKLNVNHRTGEIEALIFNNGILWGSLVGTAAIELPLSGSKSIEYIQRKLQLDNEKTDTKYDGIRSVLGNAVGATISAVHHNVAGAVGQGVMGIIDGLHSIDKVQRINYEISHTPNKITSIQKGNTSISQMNVMYPFISIQRPVMLPDFSEEIYSKTIGHATLQNKKLKQLRGYTEACNPILDGLSCTETEKEMIIKALQDGCIFDEQE